MNQIKKPADPKKEVKSNFNFTSRGFEERFKKRISTWIGKVKTNLI
jgi:hypothetical protein